MGDRSVGHEGESVFLNCGAASEGPGAKSGDGGALSPRASPRIRGSHPLSAGHAVDTGVLVSADPQRSVRRAVRGAHGAGGQDAAPGAGGV